MATATLPTTQITPEQFLELPDHPRYELIDGELVECATMSLESCTIATLIATILNNFVLPRKLGLVVDSEATFQCFPHDPNRIRRPDISFIRSGRVPREQYEHGHCHIAPNLIVEIISPNDIVYEVDEKIQDYLSAGVELIWVVNPRSRSLMAYRLTGKPDFFEADDLVTGESVLSGLQFHLTDIFPDLDAVT